MLCFIEIFHGRTSKIYLDSECTNKNVALNGIIIRKIFTNWNAKNIGLELSEDITICESAIHLKRFEMNANFTAHNL